MKLPSLRILSAIGFLLCSGLLSFAFYLEFDKGLAPCPLCILQRLIILILAILFLVTFIHHPKQLGRRIYGVLTILFSLLGIASASRQIWLQLNPPAQSGVCAPGLDYMLKYMPLVETLKAFAVGTQQCSQVLWKFLGLSIPGWTLVFFFIFTLIAILQFRRSS